MNKIVRSSAGLLAVMGMVTLVSLAQEKPAARKKWTYEEAKKQYMQSPQDVYLQYVVLQTAKREKVRPEELHFVDSMNRRTGRREGVDLFNTFSGALAIQESLQLDTMLEGQNARADFSSPIPPVAESAPTKSPVPLVVRDPVNSKPADNPDARVKVASLQGPTIKSHPWEKMLAGRKPAIGSLANCVPEDFYLIEFGSAAKLTDALSTVDLWTGHLFAQMMGTAQSQDLERRLKQQLGIQGIPPALLDAAGLQGIALTGSDLYLADGSDVTLLVQGEKLVGMRQWLEGLSKKQGTKKLTGKYLDVNFTLTTAADRSVHVYAADPRPDLHIRSTSLPAFQKVLSAIAGKNEKGDAVKRLGETTEFAYIRTILPRAASEEDGLVYLSDPFIRRLLGPQVKLTQQHRLRAFNHLKMIERAALMFRTETGRAPKSMEELAAAGCAPGVFGQGKFACPAGGKYTLSDDGMSAVSTVFGKAGWMTPLLEVPLETVSQTDADAYNQFLVAYNQYWRTFFDPIAVRIKVTPERFRLETVVLPLIDNSIYTGLAEAVGGNVVPMATLPTLPRTVHAVTAHLNKKPVLKILPAEEGGRKVLSKVDALQQIMLATQNYHEANTRLPSRAIRAADGKPLLSWRVTLLPYLGYQELYKEFHLDEPWDSDHNKKLIAQVPDIYRTGDPSIDKLHKTRLLAPVGENTLFPPDDKKITMQDVVKGRGTSNTIAFVEAVTERAVVWTRPEDLVIDWKQPHKGLLEPNQQDFLVVACDGTPYLLRSATSEAALSILLQWKGDENNSLSAHGNAVFSQHRNSFFDIPNVDIKLLRQFLDQGIGEHLTYQVLDAAQPVTADITNFYGADSPIGMMGPMSFGSEMVLIGLIAQSLTNPVCVSIPVQNADIVDRFLVELDQRLAELPRNFERFIRTEKYQVKMGDKNVRVFSLKILGMNFRIAWARMGHWLVLTNQPTMLEELAHFYEKQPKLEAGAAGATDAGEQGHVQFRIRPEGWNQVLPGYRLGWAENHRVACEVNQQQITNLARAYPELLGSDGSITPALLERVFQVYGTHGHCPDGGTYRITRSGQCECAIHGQAYVNPRQLMAPSPHSHTMKSLAHFRGLAATLTFLEDGLHAVVTIERK